MKVFKTILFILILGSTQESSFNNKTIGRKKEKDKISRNPKLFKFNHYCVIQKHDSFKR